MEGALVGGLGGYRGYSRYGGYGGYPYYNQPVSYVQPQTVIVQREPVFVQSPVFMSNSNGRTISEKLSTLGPNQVIDVSAIDSYGRGSRIIPAVTSLRNHKHGIAGIPIVSNNSRTYVQALEEVYGPNVWSTYGSQFQQLQLQYPNW